MAAKKKTAPDKKSAEKDDPPPSPDPPALAAPPEFTASPAGCLDRTDAIALVFSCTGLGPVDVDTKLGDLFLSPLLRRNFCGCVFLKATHAGATVDPGDIPCSPTTTLDDVIDSIAC